MMEETAEEFLPTGSYREATSSRLHATMRRARLGSRAVTWRTARDRFLIILTLLRNGLTWIHIKDSREVPNGTKAPLSSLSAGGAHIVDTHTNAHTNAHTRTHTNAHTNAHTYTHKRTYKRPHTYTHKRT
eukprot:GHVU01212272.1.p1 GENE.GHVU01212272.1~~GHVU01212272.1.p1  ORF type:complete len:130 (-),score=0.16 GHVU01212272.1:466-855(-)